MKVLGFMFHTEIFLPQWFLCHWMVRGESFMCSNTHGILFAICFYAIKSPSDLASTILDWYLILFPILFFHQIIWSGWALFFYVVRGWGTKAPSGETALISYSVWQQRHCNHIKQRPLTIAIKVYCVLKKRSYSINYTFTTRLSISTIIKMFKIPTNDNFLVVSHLYLGRRGMSAKQGE